ncbi:hypothetical protein AKO1_006412 [Acrasis kona]|uniref:RWP-RK domain-containing protein n=1 Tax=Acrasis kona TaxID=1008807 RepID=A0AAW2YJI4_9EUKA
MTDLKASEKLKPSNGDTKNVVDTVNKVGRPMRLEKEQIIQYITKMSQQEASKKLGVSLSTLKRRFYEMDMGKWPCKRQRSAIAKLNISFITRRDYQQEKYMSQEDIERLMAAFQKA